MIQTIKNAWKIPELRKKIMFTVFALLIFRLGSAVPVPFVNTTLLGNYLNNMSGTIFGLMNAMSGGAFATATVFALGVQPYINSSIIIQLLTVAIPALERLQKEGGEEGRKKIAAITRYTTVAIALLQGFGYYTLIKANGLLNLGGMNGVWAGIVIVVSFTAGSAFIMWLGEQINEYGIGNGISLIIFAGIIARLPSAIQEIWVKLQEGSMSVVTLVVFVVFCIVVIVGIIEVQQGQRRIPVQYAKRVVGRKMYGGQATHIPLKVNQAGVIPVIFAMSFLQFPLTITYFMNSESGAAAWIEKWLSPTGTPGVWVYAAFNVVLIIFFTYFYTSVTFNPVEVAQNMKANGGFIPGIRPGKATVEYLNRVMTRITFVGAVFLAAVAILPTIVSQLGGLNFHFGGTSLLIAVGVALDTMKQLENQMVMRNYQGFLK